MIKVIRDEWNEPILTIRIFGRKFELPLSRTREGWTLIRITGEDLEFLSPTRDRIAQYPWLDSVLDSKEPALHPTIAAEGWIMNPPFTVPDSFVADHCNIKFTD